MAAFTALAGSAAVLLGALYGLGAAVEWRRLAIAGVRVDDGLPLVPLPHILTAGIGVLLTTLASLLGTVAFLLGLRGIEGLVESGRITRRLRKRTRELRSVKVSITYQSAAAHEEANRLLSLRQRVADFKPQNVDALTAAGDREALLRLQSEGNALIAEAERQETDQNEMLAHLQRLQRQMSRRARSLKIENRLNRLIVPTLKYGPLAVAFLLGVFVVPYPIGIGLCVGGLIWRVPTKTKLTGRAARLAISVVVGASVVVSGVLSAPSLPVAHVVTKGQGVEGPLVALTDSSWYLTTGHGILVSIPASQVQSGFTTPGAARHLGTFLQLVE